MAKNSLEILRERKAQIALKCRSKEDQIGRQTDYITGNIGSIALKSIVGDSFVNGSEMKKEIIKLLVGEGIETAISIKKDPHEIKDKLVTFFKESATGVINLILK